MDIKTHVTYHHAFPGRNSVRNPASGTQWPESREPVLGKAGLAAVTSQHPYKIEAGWRESALQKDAVHVYFSRGQPPKVSEARSSAGQTTRDRP